MLTLPSQQGVFKKYVIVGADGKEVTEGSYFVLRLDTDLEAVKAALYFAGRLADRKDIPVPGGMSTVVWCMAREKSYDVLKRTKSRLPYTVVAKSDGSPVAPEAVYLVLRIDNDKEQLATAAYYADLVSAINPRLAKDLRMTADHGGSYEKAGISLEGSWTVQELGYDPETV